MKNISPVLLLATVLALPVMAQAQTAPPEKQVQTMTPDQKRAMIARKMNHGDGKGDDKGMMGMRLRDVMEKLSPEGRAVMETAMKSQMDQGRADHEKLRAARAKILVAMDADKFDASALRRAFADERALSTQVQERKHDAMVVSLSKLSTADRKIITTNMKDMQARMQMRMDKRGMGQHGQMGPMGDPGQMDMPPPPPPAK
jgi:uncharacterized membrane protein